MSDSSYSLPELASALRSRWRRMAIVGGAVFALGALFVLLTPPRYRSEALLRVQATSPGEGLLGSMADLPGVGALGLARDEVETEMGLINSRRMQDLAIDSLGLEAVMTKPKRSRRGVLDVTSRGESVLEGELRLERTTGDTWRVSATWSGDSAAVPATTTTGRPFRVGELTFTIGPNAPRDEIAVDLVPRYEVYEALDERVRVDRRSPGAKLIEVQYESGDHYLAAAVLDVMVGGYLEFVRESESSDATRTIRGLRSTSDSVSLALREADEALRDYQASARIIAPQEQASAQVKRVAALRGQLDQLEIERDALYRMLQVVDSRANGGADAGAYRQLATFPAMISNRAIQDVLATLIELENERVRRSVGRTAADPGIAGITARIEEIERMLRRTSAEYLESLEQQMREVSGALARMSDDLSALPAAEMRYVQLARQRTLLGETWVLLQKQLRQSEVQETLRQERVRLVDAPRIPQPDEAVFPNPPVHLMITAVLAVLAALTVGLVGLQSPRHEAQPQPSGAS